jgi:hypothetical protein
MIMSQPILADNRHYASCLSVFKRNYNFQELTRLHKKSISKISVKVLFKGTVSRDHGPDEPMEQ